MKFGLNGGLQNSPVSSGRANFGAQQTFSLILKSRDQANNKYVWYFALSLAL